MERADKEIKNIHEIEDILNKARIIRLALCEDNIPYVIPLNFGYKNNTIYLHTSKIGKKIDILKKNNYVSFEADVDVELVKSKNICSYSMRYKSVVGFGRAYFVSNLEEKRKCMNIIISHYLGDTYDYSIQQIEQTCILRIDIESMTGKKS